jgi:hypothetical protein
VRHAEPHQRAKQVDRGQNKRGAKTAGDVRPQLQIVQRLDAIDMLKVGQHGNDPNEEP